MADIPRFDPAFFGIPKPLELPELPELEYVDLTVSQIQAMSDSELLSVLSGESEHQGIIPIPLQQLITSELLSRTLANTSKPHWSVVPSFWLLIATTVLALVATVATILALPQFSFGNDQQEMHPTPALPSSANPTAQAQSGRDLTMRSSRNWIATPSTWQEELAMLPATRSNSA